MITDYYYYSEAESRELIKDVFLDQLQDALDWAIDDCRERARIYAMPANWEAVLLADGRIRVKRVRGAK